MYTAHALAQRLDEMKRPLDPLDEYYENGGKKKGLRAGDDTVQDSGDQGHADGTTEQRSLNDGDSTNDHAFLLASSHDNAFAPVSMLMLNST